MTAGSDVTRFRTLLAAQMGWVFADSDVPHLSQELRRRAATRDMSVESYLVRLGVHGWADELSVIAEDLSITETYFFRHGEQFRALAEVALPDRIRARAGGRALRILSMGCSSGEEAYTLAIAARQAVPSPDWSIAVTGLDANPAVLRRAAAAHYSVWSLRETPDAVRERWFRPREDGLFEVDPAITATVRFQRYNAAGEDPILFAPGQYDIIFCRNLLMYLTADTATALVGRMTGALAPGGYLFLGHTDSLGSRPDGLEACHTHSAFYYRRPSGPPATPAPRADPPPPAAPSPPAEPPRTAEHEQVLALMHQERFAEAMDLVAAMTGGRPDPRDLLLRGVLLAQAGRLDEAETVVRRLLDDNGLDADGQHLLGVCLEGGTSVDVAAGHYRLAAYLDPAFAMPRLRLGLMARRRGDHRAAAEELDRALHLLRDERDDRIVMFGGGFGRIALTTLCRAELDASGARR